MYNDDYTNPELIQSNPECPLHRQCSIKDGTINRKLSHAIAYAKGNQPDEPILMFDSTVVKELHAKWKKLMPRVQPFYAVKVNPDPILVSTLVQLGCSFDCASIEEMDLVLRLAFSCEVSKSDSMPALVQCRLVFYTL